MHPNKELINILLVEDNPGDVRLTQEAFKEGHINNKLFIVNDGVEAMSFLRKEDPYQNVPRPELILLDLNMPRKDGRQVLSEIKQDEHLKHIPVIILTTSDAEADILKSYQLQANCYITKPVDFNKFMAIIKEIKEFWLNIVHLPPKQG